MVQDSDPIRAFVLESLAKSPSMSTMLLTELKRKYPEKSQDDLRNALRRTIEELRSEGQVVLLDQPRGNISHVAYLDPLDPAEEWRWGKAPVPSFPALSQLQRDILLVLLEEHGLSRRDIARKVRPSKPIDESSVTRAMNKFRDQPGLIGMGLVTHTRGAGYCLTEAGRQAARQL